MHLDSRGGTLKLRVYITILKFVDKTTNYKPFNYLFLPQKEWVCASFKL